MSKKAQLILLENPIIVADEEIKEGDKCYHLEMNDRKTDTCCDVSNYHTWTDNGVDKKDKFRKIISHKKPIDYNGIDFGVININRLAEFKADKFEDWDFESPSGNGYYDFIDGFKEGFKASQQLNEKKFTLDEISTYFIGGNKKGSFFDDYLDYRLETNDKISFKEWFIKANVVMSIKTFEVEIEETFTTIKIIKKL